MEIKLKNSQLKFKLDTKSLFKNLVDFSLGSLLTDTINISMSIESKAYYLLYNTNIKTNIALSKKLGQTSLNSTHDLNTIFQNVEREWRLFFEQEIIIRKDFFDNVLQHNQEYLRKSFQLFKSYLEALNIQFPEDFSYEYYNTFRSNLLEEYHENKEKYKELISFFDNHFSIDNEKMNIQLQHYQENANLFTNPLQGNTDSKESLRDLYIEPYFKIYKANIVKPCQESEEFVKIEDGLTLHNFINDFYLSGIVHSHLRECYNMLFILGQPGQGKTSCCYKVIFDILEASHGLPDEPLFFLKIRDLHAKDFVDDTFSTINVALNQDVNFNKDKCILILDGLDEAYMSGGITDNDLKVLYERLNKTCKVNKKLKIILTSRLHYLKINDPSLEGSLVLKLEVLTKKQIKLYVDKFKIFHPDNLLAEKINDILEISDFKHIKELLEQPVIMYFIAIANINISKDDSKVIIYDKIFDSLAKRSWDKNGQLNYINPDLKNDYKKYSKLLRQFIRNIAFEIYQSPNLHITIKRLTELDATKVFIEKCFDKELFKTDNIKDVSKYLLISFYFQQSNKQQEDDTAIEFFHNSLWEFLTAEYFWIENKRIVQNKDEDGDYKPLRIDEYYNVLNRLVGNKEIKDEVIKNLESIIKLENPIINQEITNAIKDIFYRLIEWDMLLTYDFKNEKLAPSDKMHNIFMLAWVFYYNTSITNSENRITTNDKLNNFIFNPFQLSVIKYNIIERLDFKGHTYPNVFLGEVKLKNSSFNLDFTDFSMFRCKFTNVIFYNTYLNFVTKNIFENTVFKEVLFSKVSIIENKFINCKFQDIQLSDKNFFARLIRQNEVDDFTKNHHRVISKKEKNHFDKFVINYYLIFVED